MSHFPNDPNRGTGRTTAMIFNAMAATCKPNTKVLLLTATDAHARQLSSRAREMAHDLIESASALQIRFKNGSVLTFSSCFYKPQNVANHVTFTDHYVWQYQREQELFNNRASGPDSRSTDSALRGRAADAACIVDDTATPQHPNLARDGDRPQADACG